MRTHADAQVGAARLPRRKRGTGRWSAPGKVLSPAGGGGRQRGRGCSQLPGGAGGQRSPSPGPPRGRGRRWQAPVVAGGWGPFLSLCPSERRQRRRIRKSPPPQTGVRTCLVGVTWWRREGAAGERAQPSPEACPGCSPACRRRAPPPPPPRATPLLRRGTRPCAARRRERHSRFVEGRGQEAAGLDLQAGAF